MTYQEYRQLVIRNSWPVVEIHHWTTLTGRPEVSEKVYRFPTKELRDKFLRENPKAKPLPKTCLNFGFQLKGWGWKEFDKKHSVPRRFTDKTFYVKKGKLVLTMIRKYDTLGVITEFERG